MTAGPTLTERFSALAPGYDAVLSDVWGVIHNGVEAFADACDALIRFRAKGGRVVLITNAPRPGAVVVKLLDRLKVPREAYDAIVSSGDVTRAVMEKRAGKKVFHIGPERDLPIFDGLGLSFVPWREADYVVCTGLADDEIETPETYRGLLTDIRARGLFMLCGNPDLVVERGTRLVYCAGALADLYGELGGEVLYAGKPHAPIYDQAMQRVATARGSAAPLARTLAIGDSVRTDLTGATRYGIDCLFVTAGIHAEELGDRHDPDLSAVRKMFDEAGIAPKAITRRLVW
ncbi:MAG: TIGR01459 family HAD-type hydrolase [Alphaproteobacteria bacterium]|nr:TIGR01459 family HAD-type hydrolase [Alphaproteobacteria bacterium]